MTPAEFANGVWVEEPWCGSSTECDRCEVAQHRGDAIAVQLDRKTNVTALVCISCYRVLKAERERYVRTLEADRDRRYGKGN